MSGNRLARGGGALAAACALAAYGPGGADAFAPAVRSGGQRLLAPGAAGQLRLGRQAPPQGGRAAGAGAGAAVAALGADAAALSAEAAAHTTAAEKYDDTEFFESFMSSVISRVDEREEGEVWRAPGKLHGAMKLMDGVVVVASCFMAMHVFSVWMALGFWVALRANSLLETASDAGALVVAFATGSPLDSASRQNVLSNQSNLRRAKWQRRAAEMFEEEAQKPALVATSAAVAAPASALAVSVPESSASAEARGEEVSGVGMSEKEQREMAARKARAELWELAKDIGFIGSHYTRKAAQKVRDRAVPCTGALCEQHTGVRCQLWNQRSKACATHARTHARTRAHTHTYVCARTDSHSPSKW